MKLSLPVKLGIFVVLLFGVVIAFCVLWRPLKARYHVGQLLSKDANARHAGVASLIAMGERGKKALVENFPDGEEAAAILLDYWKRADADADYDLALATFVEEVPGNTWMFQFSNCKALHVAARKNYTVLAELLIRQGADVQPKAHYTWKGKLRKIGGGTYGNNKYFPLGSPLHVAARYDNVETMRLLIEMGADVDIRGNMVFTPLHAAVKNGSIRAVHLLLGKKADVNSCRGGKGRTPLDWAITKERKEIEDLLRANGGKTREELSAGEK
ncbi:MAG: ankyrin repeat domain-containing protein [Planctomycetota bacterium]|jgi:hypothetical protein